MRYIITLLTLGICSFSQAQYIDSCTITFEKTIFIKNILKDNENVKRWISNLPQEYKESYTLLVRPEATQYFGVNQEDARVPGLWGYTLNKNELQTNLTDSTYAERKDIYDKKVFILDSTRHYDWTISNSYRKIAGFNCRQASTVIFDSIRVFAFYTPLITPSAGPDCFHGLPGCILGVAIPDIHHTWYAIKIEESMAALPSKYLYSKKSDEMNNQKLSEILADKFGQMPAQYRKDKSFMINQIMLLL
jgi:GLPGLI family protein